MSKVDRQEALLSIGALSRATSVPVPTLRTWERRYNLLEPVRMPSGHRRYPVQAVDEVRTIVKLLDSGHRPSSLRDLDPDDRRRLLARTAPAAPTPERAPSAGHREVQEWLTLARQANDRGLRTAFQRDWNRFGALPFVRQRVMPFLVAMGEAWQAGDLSIAQEHATSERLREFLSVQWRTLSDLNEGPRVVCGTLPGEVHVLGLHLAAICLAEAGASVVFLGSSTPAKDIAEAADQRDAAGIAVSVSGYSDSAVTERELRALAEQVDIPVVVGGRGAVPEDVEGVTQMESFVDLYEWAKKLPR